MLKNWVKEYELIMNQMNSSRIYFTKFYQIPTVSGQMKVYTSEGLRMAQVKEKVHMISLA